LIKTISLYAVMSYHGARIVQQWNGPIGKLHPGRSVPINHR